MRRKFLLRWAGVLFIGCAGSASTARAVITADAVTSFTYDPGTVLQSYWGVPYSNPSAVLGLPDARQGVPDVFDAGGTQIAFADNSVITPFNGQFNPSNILALNNQASITVHLSAPIIISAGAAVGVHSGAGLKDTSYPSGQNLPMAIDYTNPRLADLEVSDDDVKWVDLGVHSFDNPTLIYSNQPDAYGAAPGTTPADCSKPFYGSVSSFNGLDWSATRAAFDGSAGGNWFSLSGVNLPAVNFVRLNTATGQTIYVDAIVGTAPVPEPCSVIFVSACFLLGRRRR